MEYLPYQLMQNFFHQEYGYLYIISHYLQNCSPTPRCSLVKVLPLKVMVQCEKNMIPMVCKGKKPFVQENSNIPLEHTPGPQPLVYKGNPFIFVVWGTWGLVPRVCWDFLRVCLGSDIFTHFPGHLVHYKLELSQGPG